jgi:hypothetical protein
MPHIRATVPAARFVFAVAVVIRIAGIRSVTQTDQWVGTWTAPEQDRGVTVRLTIGQSSTLVIPGIGPGGKVAALTLLVRDFRRAAERATFMVDLPDNEGVIEWELRAQNTRDVVILRALTVDGEPADDDTPSWTLRHQRER